jgi:hypothetical protein
MIILASVGFMPAGPRLFSYHRFAQKPAFLFLPPSGRKKEKGGRVRYGLSSSKFRLRRGKPDGRLIGPLGVFAEWLRNRIREAIPRDRSPIA